jgi:uncharacterized protein YjbI with pentapeptide repeats
MKIALPQISDNLETLQNLRRLILRDETLTTAHIQNEDLSQFKSKSFAANELRLEKVLFGEARLEKTSFSDAEFINCDLTATVFSEASWRRTAVKNCRGSGLQLQVSTLKDVTFTGCKLDLANFRFAKLTNVLFEDCVLDEADFYNAHLKNVWFQGCILHKTEFSGAKLDKVDLRTSDITTISGISTLAGATIDSTQLIALAPLLAHELKIIVDDN